MPGKKYLIPLLTILWVGLFTLSTHARIPTVAFKGVTKYFKPGKEFYSPTLGIIAIETGLIHNLRFYGNFKADYKEAIREQTNQNPIRNYIYDKPGDPLWQVLSILFPSPAGNLAVETESPHNFGKHVTFQKTVALLLDYVHQLRTKGTYAGERQYPPASQKAGKEKVQKDVKMPESLSITVKAFKEALSAKIISATPAQIDLLNGNEKIDLSSEQIQAYVSSKQGKGRKDLDQRKADPLTPLVEGIFNSLSITPETLHNNLKSNIRTLLDALAEAIVYEAKSIYPYGTTEQIILAFFCEKFNSQRDIWLLIKALAELDQDQEMIQGSETLNPNVEDLFTKEDLESMAQAGNIDAIYLLANGDIFTRLTPYKEGTEPISNGSTYPYDRARDKVLTDVTFADCVEEVLRHICNIAGYNPITRSFDFSHLTHNNPPTPYITNLVAFYAHQNLMLANAGDIQTRSLWNKVVGDLNAIKDHGPTVAYHNDLSEERKSYNMLPGFINMIQAFRKVLNLDIQNSSHQDKEWLAALNLNNASLVDLQRWVKAYLTFILETLNPKYSYQLDTSKLTIGQRYNQGGQDVFGGLSVIVKDKNENLFSFTISFTQGHGQLNQLKSLLPPSQNYAQDVAAPLLGEDQTSLSSLKLLIKQKAWTKMPPLYALYPTLIQDNATIIQNLTYLSQLREENLDFYKNPVSHLLDNLNWDDQHTVRNVSRLLLSLQERFPLETRNHVLGFISSEVSQEQLGDIETKFPKLKSLGLKKNLHMKELSLDNLHQLAWIDLSDSPVSKVHLNNLPSLNTLNLNNTINLKELSLSNLNQLSVLILVDSPVSTIQGLENLTSLKELYLNNTKNLHELSLGNLNHLTKLSLTNSSVSKIEGLEYLTSLQHLLLSDTKNLKELTVSNLNQLTYLSLSGSPVSTIQGLEKLTNLTELYLDNTENLKELSLNNLSQLTVIDLSQSSVSKIHGLENLVTLKDLYLNNTKNLPELSLGNFYQLTKFTMAGSSISKIKGLENLIALEELDLNNTYNLQELPLSNLNQLIKLGLSGSSVSKVHLENLTALKELYFINTKNLQELSLKNLKQLIRFDLSNTSVSKVFLENLTALPGLKLLNTKNLQYLSLRNLPQLVGLDLTDSSVSIIEGLENLTALKILNLVNTKNLKEVSLGHLNSLTGLSLAGSSVSKIQGLENLTALEKLYLGNTNNLEELSLSNLSKLTLLSLANSSVSKVHLENLTALRQLNLTKTTNLQNLSLINLNQLTRLGLSGSSVSKIQGLESLPPEVNIIRK